MLIIYFTSSDAYNADGLLTVRYELAVCVTVVRFCYTEGRRNLGHVFKFISGFGGLNLVLVYLILFHALDEAKQSSGLSPACQDAARTAGASCEGRKEGRKEGSRSKTAPAERSVTNSLAGCQWCCARRFDVTVLSRKVGHQSLAAPDVWFILCSFVQNTQMNA